MQPVEGLQSGASMTRARGWCVAVLFSSSRRLRRARRASAKRRPSPSLPSFGEWLQTVRTDALARGIKPSTLDIALTGLEPVPTCSTRSATGGVHARPVGVSAAASDP